MNFVFCFFQWILVCRFWLSKKWTVCTWSKLTSGHLLCSRTQSVISIAHVGLNSYYEVIWLADGACPSILRKALRKLNFVSVYITTSSKNFCKENNAFILQIFFLLCFACQILAKSSLGKGRNLITCYTLVK